MDADSLVNYWSIAPPDTMLVVAPAASYPVGFVLGGIAWYFLACVAVIFALLTCIDWQRAREAGRRWPWD